MHSKRYRIAAMAAAFLVVVAIVSCAKPPPETVVSIDAYSDVLEGGDFMPRVYIDDVDDLVACNYDVVFDDMVLQLDDVTAGQVNGAVIPVSQWNLVAPGRVRIVQNLGVINTATGSGILANLQFHVIGTFGGESDLDLQNGMLGDTTATEILAQWVDGHVTVVAAGHPWLEPIVTIDMEEGALVDHTFKVRGSFSDLPPEASIWVLIQPHNAPRYHPQSGPAIEFSEELWSAIAYAGESPFLNIGEQFEVMVVVADREASYAFLEYLRESQPTGSYVGMPRLPEGAKIVCQRTVTRR